MISINEYKKSLCRYGSRPAIAIYRLTKLEDGKYQYSLKYPLRNGSYKLILTGQELMRRLALLVPRPRIHLIVEVLARHMFPIRDENPNK